MDITPARDNDEDADSFCALFNALYDRKVDRAYYRWQFFATPFPSILQLARDQDGRVVGSYGYHLVDLAGGGRIGQALDIMIAPAFRGSGLFRRIATAASEAAESYAPIARYVVANKNALAPHVEGLGWELLRAQATFVATTRPPASELVVEQVDSTVALEGEAIDYRTGLAIKRSAAYLAWRFDASPWYRYELFRATETGQFVGYLVLKRFTDPVTGIQSGDIVECRSVSGGPIDALLAFAINYFGELPTTTWMPFDPAFEKAGVRFGFTPRAPVRYLCAHGGPAVDDWHLNMADAEIY